MTHPEARSHLSAFVAKMQDEGLPPLVIDTFAFYYKQLLTGETGLVYDREIQPVKRDGIENFKNLKKYRDAPVRSQQLLLRVAEHVLDPVVAPDDDPVARFDDHIGYTGQQH